MFVLFVLQKILIINLVFAVFQVLHIAIYTIFHLNLQRFCVRVSIEVLGLVTGASLFRTHTYMHAAFSVKEPGCTISVRGNRLLLMCWKQYIIDKGFHFPKCFIC